MFTHVFTGFPHIYEPCVLGMVAPKPRRSRGRNEIELNIKRHISSQDKEENEVLRIERPPVPSRTTTRSLLCKIKELKDHPFPRERPLVPLTLNHKLKNEDHNKVERPLFL